MNLATGGEKTWQEKTRSRTQRNALCEPARVPEWAQRTAQNADEHLREPAQSKRMSKYQKSHLIRKFTGKKPQTKTALHTLCEPARSKRNETHVKMSEEPLCTEIYRKNAGAQNRDHTLCEPAQATGKMPSPRVSTLIKHWPLLSQ